MRRSEGNIQSKELQQFDWALPLKQKLQALKRQSGTSWPDPSTRADIGARAARVALGPYTPPYGSPARPRGSGVNDGSSNGYGGFFIKVSLFCDFKIMQV
ncbi:hypothetical protein L3X38_023239 [Prunus dulcis]|uniref:Uncharacterized protein n=1 Tax=Prunus dulcis TaxID=3755 RepID=A0AAD4VZ42_PRUDU|nr:hypothetical protein L3X38_023239 [Prunus dulcis]